MFDRDGKPKVVNLWGLLMVVVVLLIYAAFVPFDFVFKDDSGVVFTQRGLSVFSNFERDVEEIAGSEVVYGEDAVDFCYTSGGKNVVYSSSYTKLRVKMFLTAAKNLVTLNWDRESFVIEMYAVQN